MSAMRWLRSWWRTSSNHATKAATPNANPALSTATCMTGTRRRARRPRLSITTVVAREPESLASGRRTGPCRRPAGRVSELEQSSTTSPRQSRHREHLDDEHDPEGATLAFERAQVVSLLEEARAPTQPPRPARHRMSTRAPTACANAAATRSVPSALPRCPPPGRAFECARLGGAIAAAASGVR